MMAAQFHTLTGLRLHQVWPERSGRAKMEVTMMIDQLQMIVATLQTRHRMDIEATREGETRPGLDQVDWGDIEEDRGDI